MPPRLLERERAARRAHQQQEDDRPGAGPRGGERAADAAQQRRGRRRQQREVGRHEHQGERRPQRRDGPRARDQEHGHGEREVRAAQAQRDVEQREGQRAEQERETCLGHHGPDGGRQRDERERPALRVRRQRAERHGAGDGGQRRAAGALRDLGGAAERPEEALGLLEAPRLQGPAAQEVVQRLAQVGRRRALGRPRRAGRVDQRDELAGQVRAQRRQRRQARGGDVGERLRRGVPAQRMSPGQQLVQHHAGGVDVAGRLDAAPGRLLRRHVGDGADHVAVAGERVRVHEVGDAEVHDLDVPPVVEHDVLGLDVAVDDALAVRVRERVEELHPDRDHIPVVQLVAQLVERVAADELPDEDAALIVREPVVERDDVGVVERRGRLDLAHDARAERPPVGDDLERDGLLQRQVVGLEDLGEPAAADLADQLVAVAPVLVIGGGALRGDGHSGTRFGLGFLDIRCGTIRTLSGPMGEWRNWQTR